LRITCPLCGERDLREFSFRGADVALQRPDEDAQAQAWDDYLHNRDNPAGLTRDLWQHQAGCGAWLVLHRDNSSHEIHSVALARSEAAK